MFYSDAIPGAGDHPQGFVVGDIVINNAPSAGEPVGWRCTTAGNPGTWEPIGGNTTRTISASGSMTMLDSNMHVATGGGAVAVALVDPVTCGGKMIMVSREGANAATFTGKINEIASATLTLTATRTGATLFSDGAFWRVTGAFGTVTVA